jgi:hypothetical protein
VDAEAPPAIGDEYVMGRSRDRCDPEPGVIRQVSDCARMRFGEMDGRPS